jgi:hypothetical protein
MQNSEHYRGGSRAPGARVKEFFAKLRGLWAPKYIPQRLRHGDVGRTPAVQKSDFGAELDDMKHTR